MSVLNSGLLSSRCVYVDIWKMVFVGKVEPVMHSEKTYRPISVGWSKLHEFSNWIKELRVRTTVCTSDFNLNTRLKVTLFIVQCL